MNQKRTNEHTYVKAYNRGEADYARGIRSEVYALWLEMIDEFTFIDTMVFAVYRGLHRAWFEGAQECGVMPDELTREEVNALDKLTALQYAHIVGFAAEIVKNQKSKKGKLSPLYKRAELWINEYGQARNMAKQMACKDKKLKWVFNPLKEHCSDCARLDGRVYRQSVWAKYDLYPRMSRLECGGWRCGCEFQITDDPITRGRPPRI